MSSNHFIDMLYEYYFIKGYEDAYKEILLEMDISVEMFNAKKELDELKEKYSNYMYDQYRLDPWLKHYLKNPKFYTAMLFCISNGITTVEELEWINSVLKKGSMSYWDYRHCAKLLAQFALSVYGYYKANKVIQSYDHNYIEEEKKKITEFINEMKYIKNEIDRLSNKKY